MVNLKFYIAYLMPVSIMIVGINLSVTALIIIKWFYPDQSEYLPWQPATMFIALLTAMWLGKAQPIRRVFITYIWFGFLFAMGCGFFGMLYLKMWGYVNNIHQYPDAAPWGVGNFLMLVAQSFAIGGLTTDRGVQQALNTSGQEIASDGKSQRVAMQTLYVAIITFIVNAISMIGTWLPLLMK